MSEKAILCVDDEAIILLSMKEELKTHFGNSYIYETAMNAQKALKIIEELEIKNVKIVLIISDWLMPGMKGDEFLKIVKERYSSINAIMVTGQASKDSVKSVITECLASEVILKPWNSAQLFDAVRRCIPDEQYQA